MPKQKTIRGILIDVNNLTVTEVELENSLQGIYEKLNCDLITKVAYPYDDNHDIIVDDEGLFKANQTFFTFDPEDMDASLCGNGLIVSFDEDGNWTSHRLDIDDVREKVTFQKYIKCEPGIVIMTFKNI